jgi:hypothetical protein
MNFDDQKCQKNQKKRGYNLLLLFMCTNPPELEAAGSSPAGRTITNPIYY